MFDFLLNVAAHGFARAGFGTMLVYLLAMTQLTILAVTLYLHRSQTHRSVDFHPVLAHFFRFWVWLTTSMVTKEWVAIHRKHHAHSDTAHDPHSPHIFGIGKLLWEGTELYTSACNDEELLAKYGSGTPDDWVERHIYTPHSNWGPTVLAVVNLLLFGVVGMAIWAVQMMWIPFWAAGVVNGLGHWRGYRNYETADRSANLMPWGFWVGGEELHNNHHAFPSSAKFSVRRFEFDAGWLVIQVLAKLRLADVKRIACAQPITYAAHQVRLTPRVRVMTEYFRYVMRPALRDETRRRSDDMQSLSRHLRGALADGGHWLAADDRERLVAWINARPCMCTLWEFRARLAVLMEQRSIDAPPEGLLQWANAAENSGISSLRTFAMALLDSMDIEQQSSNA